MKIFGRELTNPLVRPRGNEETALQKLTKHVSTSGSFEDRQAGVTNCWLHINSSALPLEDKFVSGQFVGGRVTWAKILFDDFLVPYVDALKNDFLNKKLKAMTIKFANWDRHYISLKRNNPDDLETQKLDFEFLVVVHLRRVASLCWPGELTKPQDNFFYQEMPGQNFRGYEGRDSPEIEAAKIAAADTTEQV